MRFLVNISRVLVGVLFIISGFIKLNDPLGFSYKLQEYFSVEVLNLPFLEPYALIISVLVVVFEVVLGIFLLIGYKPKFTVWSLLLMIIFFTFLTFYSAYFDKVKDCGCFGDALKLTPWESFTKDVVLLALILILFYGVKHIKPILGRLGLSVAALLSFVACLWFAYHVLMHLPAIDFRPYNVGANITDNMTVPDDAPKADINYNWVFEINGKQEVITTKGDYPNVDGKYIDVTTEVLDPGYEAPIHDFTIEKDGQDFAEDMLSEDNLIMIVAYNLSNSEPDGLSALKEMTMQASKKGYRVIGMTASGPDVQEKIKTTYGLDFDFYFCDETALKTIVRSSPGILKLKKGTIIQKLHWNDIDELEL
ncbi:BT_3928 family protein [Corallibacter sp.]|uniref:BT_3928 family protein n=1 Tax=Corallibacter sp. TaxID=2038084 RepID=UPI003AB6A846